MSEENNLGTNNLCTTEDAFEQFQAIAMYEEDEFITLSDILPPQPVVPDLSNELNEIPYDNEVVLSSTRNEDAQCINSKVESSFESNETGLQCPDKIKNNGSKTQVTSQPLYYQESGLKLLGTTKVDQKRGRKKTKPNENHIKDQKDSLNVSGFLVTDSKTFTDTQVIQDSVLSTTVGKNGTESKNETQGETKYPRRTRRERVLNTAKYPLLNSEPKLNDSISNKNTPVKRLGRSKRGLENSIISEPDSTNIDNASCQEKIQDNLNYTESSELDESSKKIAVQRGRRGRPNMSSTPNNVEQVDDSSNNISEINTVSNNKKSNRRGRKKLSQVNERQLDSIESLHEPDKGTDLELPKMNLQSEDKKLSLCESIKDNEQTQQDIDCNSLDNDTVKKIVKQVKKKKVIAKCIDSNMEEKLDKSLQKPDDMDLDNDDEADNICLSKLKQDFQNSSENLDDVTGINVDIQNISGENVNSTKRNSKAPIMADFEYNIDKIVKEPSLDGKVNEADNIDESLLIEDTSKRPNRRKAKQQFKYDEDSDEDPFANVELSDEDEPRSRKKGRYTSDDEYLPGRKRGMKPITSDSDSELNEDIEGGKKLKRKKYKSSDGQSPRKRGRKSKAETSLNESQEAGNEECLEPSLIKEEPLSMKPPAEAWATSNEFENFIAQKIQGTNLKIKKVSSKQKTESVVTRLEIPVIDQNEPKKTNEISSQTFSTPTISTGMQTCVPYDIPMKTNLSLSSEQSERACEFLNSVVKTTVELGQLMKDKSEDFMNKKINTENVTDTFKMDYCVRKSFLLFKLAKHNLMQMEEDLFKKYDEFLKNNGLSACRDELKTAKAKLKQKKADSDSDCEIVDVKEVPKPSTKKEKPKFNPKTVFLNKELSIKIAKKPSADKNIDIKGRHTVWINDSVMVKKIKPTQSFLAQDSRNKKPPDYVTEKMVSDFFEDYYHQKAIAVCAPYINTEWSSVNKEYVCHYFVKCNDFDIIMNVTDNNASTSNGNCYDIASTRETLGNNPKSLSSLCTEVVCNFLHDDKIKEANEDLICNLTDGKNENQPLTLFRLCIQSLPSKLNYDMSKKPSIHINMEEKNKSITILPLKTLCYQKIAELMPFFEELSNGFKDIQKEHTIKDIHKETGIISNIGTLDYNNVNMDFNEKNVTQHRSECEELVFSSNDSNYCEGSYERKNGLKSLLSLCAKSIQRIYGGSNKPKITGLEEIGKFHPMINIGLFFSKISSPRPLKDIVYESMKHSMYGDKLTDCFAIKANTLHHTEKIFHSNENTEDFTINCINTMSDNAFHSLEEPNENQDDNDFNYEPDIEEFEEDNRIDENEWASQVQMQELRSCVASANNLTVNEYYDVNINSACVASTINTTESEFVDTNIENYDQYQNTRALINNLIPAVQIKLEPLDDIVENVDPSIVKTEPVHGLDGMTIIPESVVTKCEMIDHGTEAADSAEKESAAYDVSTFEQFVRTNKMMRSMDEYSDSEEMFSQSGLRIRRQHEPDNDADNDLNMSLLVPHTFEPLHIENAKGVLMESSSDEGKDNGAKKTGRKKTERKKGKGKKGKESVRNSNSKDIPTIVKDVPSPAKEIPASVKEKPDSINEVTILTRRMREKIRQEEKKIESTDSETENISLSLRRDKHKKEFGKNKKQEEKKIESADWETDNLSLNLRRDKNKKENEKNMSSKNFNQGEFSKVKEVVDNEIQCSNVDSTEQLLENEVKSGEAEKFNGFTAMDQNDISTYEKYMKLVYDKIIPNEDTREKFLSDFDGDHFEISLRSSPLLNPDDPVELLECEPTMPIFDNDTSDKAVTQPKKKSSKKKGNKQEVLEHGSIEKDKPKFSERHGWHCYSFDTNDVKIYQNCHIPLEKLPESFVETYLEYHNITNRDKIDKEVDRLVNLQTLNRATSIKEGISKSRQKGKTSSNEQSASEQNCTNVSRVPSPTNSDYLDELTPSEDEDEDANVDDEHPPSVPMRTTENYIAKNSLMDENESDSDGGGVKKIKTEPKDTDEVQVKRKPGPKSRTENKVKADNPPSNESLMLTADKMMNKELSLLHAPLVLKEEVNDTPVNDPSPKDETKLKKRIAKNMSLRERFKNEDDSSSEEEKQWVSTKEKLLKRMGKKEDASLDDAKRAKLVDDFIERRGDAPGKRRAGGASGRRSRKKFLEKLKQQRVLSKELYGEPDALPGGKRGAAVGLFKGRRNIRKVIDKKSLQKSTVLANMEEFERKRRLNARQNQLRELLGCEEGVNVLVINDEVCLEYGFREQRPVVTVHPFFTKVMKAHQYEGVKFMWDACFESLEAIEAGRAGGGCILAHCMGLGKTLQVLALLHTVLTHPRAGMHRVLVCCPLSTVLNWVDEIHKWIGPVTDQIKVFELSKLKKTYERAYQLEDWYTGGGIFIIGYELFRSLTTLDPQIDEIRPTIINKIRTALLNPGPDIVICDEGHLLKNDCSVLAVAMSRVVTKRRIILTGTPMQNNLREYYCMVNFVKPNLLGTYSEYSNRFENPIMNGQHRDSSEEDIKLMKARTHILHKVLEGCLQRQEASVLYPYLPKKHEYTVFIPLTKCQWDLYKHYVHHYTKENKQSVLKDFHILQKIWSHPQVLHNFQIKSRDDAKKKEIKAEKLEDDLALEDKEDIKPTDTEVWWLQYLADGAMLNSLDSSNKFVAVFSILRECIALGDKVLIFSTSLFCLDALEYFLKQINGWSLGQEYFRLDGSVPPEVRQKWCREYNAENNVKTKLFLISTRAGCLGLNMTAANRVIILDTSWNPAHDIQSIFRVYRFGQKKDCYIYRLVAMGTMEQKIYERSVTKQAVACRVVDEQQIDRHYNMAELTELYRFDEFGSGVAGGVAVGVGDVALLRVARDAAVHAVHEHDSLLRGSGEQGLPEHERAAAWMQFQQEHANKQMQNDLETDRAAQALKKLQEKELLRQQLAEQRLARQQAQVLNIKTEDGPVHENLLVPRENQPAMRGRGARRGGRRKIVQCCIPIISEEPGPSHTSQPIGEEEIVRQISDILIKFNFTQSGRGPKQIKELVSKVKQMIQTGEPISFAGSDELTTSIANVLLQRQAAAPAAAPAPALTDVSPEEPKRSRGRPRKSTVPVDTAPAVPPPAVVEQEEEYEVGGRRRRKAALAAERQFDMSDDAASQDSAPSAVIQLDDDDWRAAASDTDSATDTTKTLAKQQKPPEVQKQRARKKTVIPPDELKSNPDDGSILLSDDETPPNLQQTTQTADEVIPLHSSLLSNQNFVKIVAHTYLAGNPMLDEDAATLAAQYSTLRLLKETESSGKPIDSGPIYDIAVKVLGKEVLRKLQTADPETKDSRGDPNAASTKLMQLLGQEPAAEPAPAPKPKPGPKSQMKQDKEKRKIGIPQVVHLQQNATGIVPVTLMRRASLAVPAAGAPADECILPDDDDVRCVSEPALPALAPQHPPKPAKLKLRLVPVKKEQDAKLKVTLPSPTEPASIRVTAGDGAPSTAPAKFKTYATICLDSDEDEPPVASAPASVSAPAAVPASSRALRAARQQAQAQLKRSLATTAEGPVPVALTGPNSQPIPLPLGMPAAHASASQPYYSFSSATSATPNDPIPVSLTGPDSRPVPISLTGPVSRPVPISLTGPGFQAIPISMTGVGPQTNPASCASAPMSFAGGAETITDSYAGGAQSVPTTFTVSSSGAGGIRPVAMSYVGAPGSIAQPLPLSSAGMSGAGAGGIRTIRLSAASPQPGAAVHQVASNVYLMPAAGERVLSRVPASQVPLSQRVDLQPASAPPPPGAAPAPQKTFAPLPNNKTICKPGDILRLTKSGQLEVLRNSSEVIHTIDDDEPLAEPTAKTSTNAPTPNTPTSIPYAQTPNQPISKRPPSKPTVQPASKPNNADKESTKRKIWSSSSSSSDSSRSPSPDPLSILKDVVHIQAPERRQSKTLTPIPGKPETPTPKQPSTANPSSKATPKPAKPTAEKEKRKDDVIAKKLNNILASVKSKSPSGSSGSKSAPGKSGATLISKLINSKTAVANIKESIDLTEITFKPVKPSDTSNSNLKGGKLTSTSKKDGSTTVVGTSKNIVLDVKSKSLTNSSMVDLTGQTSVQVTNVKSMPPCTSKQKPLEKKRPAPLAEATAPKKKKTELMTLKDFDIDDIDDIIELD